MASISANSLPARTHSAVARSPSNMPKASIIIDLPAPVSPVRIFNPGPNTRCRSSIMAKLRICNSVNIVCLASRPSTPLDQAICRCPQAHFHECVRNAVDVYRYCFPAFSYVVHCSIDSCEPEATTINNRKFPIADGLAVCTSCQSCYNFMNRMLYCALFESYSAETSFSNNCKYKTTTNNCM